jgi:cell wall assembly regulator SMI1
LARLAASRDHNRWVAPVEESWTRIVDWLTRSAPATAAQIAPPPPPDEVRQAAKVVGRELPDDLACWWQVTGFAPDSVHPLLPWLHVPLTIADALEARRFWLDLHVRMGETIVSGEAGEPSRSFQSAFVPIAADRSGQYLFVDLRDGPLRGCVAQWDHERSFDDAIRWASVTDMLSDIADALCHGVPAMTFHAAARLRHFAGYPEVPVDTYRARATETGHLAWAAESF